MWVAVLLLSCVASCSCEIDFSDRPRNFSIEFMYHTQRENDGKNIVLSPFGVWSLMSQLLQGTTQESYQQLAFATFLLKKKNVDNVKSYRNLISSVLGSNTNEASLSSTNYMFLDKNFEVKQEFRQTIEDECKAVVKVLDFQNPAEVDAANAEVSKTGADVKNVLKISDFTRSAMVLTNVISFRGLWSTPFEKIPANSANTEPFYDENLQEIGNVNMMHQNSLLSFANIRGMDSYALEIPLGNNGKYSMLFLLPHPNVNVIDAFKKLSEISLPDIFKQMEDFEQHNGKQGIDVKIPRFRILTDIVLNKPLNNMGVNDIFDKDLASFGRVSNEDVFVSAIVHKAYIQVEEDGVTTQSIRQPPLINRNGIINFHANRPFMYFLVEKSTTTILIEGIYSKPEIYAGIADFYFPLPDPGKILEL